ncbi:hypothetical protein BO78DRAFT_395878 [Aspergillus sclerotiicarbonarius CBS 121057]|uniref:Uncharacterized protein n=1 Tax=Aspergillus sclerotiicarbonarius (strain CBS 121057 / IBT 28362) TaxID=1448318 RepID=A0A319F025_ASPSB|nr:hypothetical protein BO78DRAFT_395878 [Aspergillus sclerotiicarbonarius CBS 121057]
MQLLAYLPLALSTLGLTSASPIRRAESPALTWHVSNFTTGCSPGGCTYNFNIFGIATANTPGFNTTCSGTDTTSDLTSCADPLVRSRVQPETYPQWNIRVEHAWTEPGDMEFYDFGETNVTSPARLFTIPVTEEYGVA